MTYCNKMIKLFFKVPQVVLAYAILLCVSNIHMYKTFVAFFEEYKEAGVSATDALYFYGDLRYICIVFFICWLFISFEYSRKLSASSIKEVFVSLGKRSVFPFLNQLLVLFLAILAFTLNIAVYAVIAYVKLDCPPALVPQIIKVLVLDVLLLSMASAGVGLLLASLKRKFAGYAVFLLLIVYMIPDYYGILQDTFYHQRTWMQGIHRILCFLPQDVSYTYDALYGLPLESYRVLGMLFWIALGCLVFVGTHFIKNHTHQKIAVSIYGVFLMVLLISTVNSGSVLRMDDTLRNVTSYYSDNPGKTETVSYQIKKYQIDFSIGKQLSANCKMELTGDAAQSEYLFTLYHNYKVSRVYDGNSREMDYTQDGDYITVYADTPTQTIQVNYSGAGDSFYSNYNACFLPGFFPYYPKVGACQPFSPDTFVFTQSHDATAEFDVSVNCSKDIVINLPKSGERYQGSTENITILSGCYEKIEEDSDTYVVLPLQKSSYQITDTKNPEGMQAQAAERLKYWSGTSLEPLSQPLIIAMPSCTVFSTLLDTIYATDSYLLINSHASASDIVEASLSAKEYGSLKQIFFDINPGPDFDIRNYEYRKDFLSGEYYNEKEQLYDAVLEKLETVGVQQTARKIYQYISSDSYADNIANELAFVQSIQE